MNLVEFPLALLSERAPRGVLTLQCSDEIEEKGIRIRRQVVVAAAEKFGLPTAKDEDVLMGLLQLSKLRNEFASPVVHFTRLELIEILGWDNTRWSYERIALALERWLSVSITYNKAWRDNKHRQWQDRSGFGLIDSYQLRDSRRAAEGGEGAGPPTGSLSWFRWNGCLFDSFRSGYIKKIDYRVYRDLQQQAAKRLYRYLDKHFYEPHRLRLDFDLQTLAFEHLGMSRGYDSTQIRRALQPAVEELEGIGFIEKLPAEERYRRLGRGRWRVSFGKAYASRPSRPTATRDSGPARVPTPAERRRESRHSAGSGRVRSYLDSLGAARRADVEREALAAAAPFLRQTYFSRKEGGGPLFEQCRSLILRQHVLGLLADPARDEKSGEG